MEYLTNFHFQHKEPTETEPKLSFNYKFYELISNLKGKLGLNLETTYLKNLDLLRESLKIDRKLPDLDWLEKSFKEIFLSK